MPGGREATHIHADLRYQHLGNPLANAKDGLQTRQGLLKEGLIGSRRLRGLSVGLGFWPLRRLHYGLVSDGSASRLERRAVISTTRFRLVWVGLVGGLPVWSG